MLGMESKTDIIIFSFPIWRTPGDGSEVQFRRRRFWKLQYLSVPTAWWEIRLYSNWIVERSVRLYIKFLGFFRNNIHTYMLIFFRIIRFLSHIFTTFCAFCKISHSHCTYMYQNLKHCGISKFWFSTDLHTKHHR